MEARGALGRPFWDSSPLMTPIFITWTIPGHFFLVRAVPGAVPTAAASMDGSDGRPDGSPGGGGVNLLQVVTLAFPTLIAAPDLYALNMVRESGTRFRNLLNNMVKNRAESGDIA